MVSVLACRTGLDVPDEPEYNPDLHLALAPPAWLKLLPDYKHAHQVSYEANSDNRSVTNLPLCCLVHSSVKSAYFLMLETVVQAPAGRLAYSAPHSFLSAEGVRVLREIVGRETQELQPSRGNRIALRLPHWP